LGARGKIASGKQKPLPRSSSVPPVEPEQVREGLDVLRTALAEQGVSDRSGPEWQKTYELAQHRLHARHPRMLADRILWRATFLHALTEWSEFQELHRDDGDLPTPDMLEVAAAIPTYGDDTSFDLYMFEERLAERSRDS
jgi:hypothetical protein